MTMVEERVSKLEGAYEQVDQRLGDLRTDMNARFDELRADTNARFDELRTEMGSMRGEIGGLRAEMNTKFNLLILVIATGGAAIAGSLVAMALRI